MPYRDGAAPFYWWTSDDVLVDVGTPLGIGRSIPRVESAVSIDQTHVRVAYSQEVKHVSPSNPDDALNPANYAFSGTGVHALTASSVALVQADPTIVDVAIVETEMTIGTNNYRVTVSGVQSPLGDVVSPVFNYGDFSGQGVRPQVSSATSLDGSTIEIVFSEGMDDTGLTTPGNYLFTGPTGPPPAPIVASVVTKMSPTTVRVTVTGEMQDSTWGGPNNYSVEVSNVRDLFFNTIDPAADTDTFNGIGDSPDLDSAVAVDSTHVRLTFTEAMYASAAIETASRYHITGVTTPVISFATLEPPLKTTVLLTCSEMRDGGAYSVSISPKTGIIDSVGNQLNPFGVGAPFTGIGVSPEISAIAWVAEPPLTPTIRVFFSEDMGATGLLDPDNYEVTGGPLAVTVVDVDPWIVGEDSVVLTLGGGEMKIGAPYFAKVHDVVDKAGNTISPNPDQMAFLGKGIRPTVVSAELLDEYHIRVTFDEAMKVEAALTLKTNYSVAGPTVITVNSVAVVVGSDDKQVDLTVSGTFTTGIYEVTVVNVRDLAENTIDPAGNTGDFVVVDPAKITAKGYPSNLTVVRITYSKDVKMVNPANPDDALNPVNYTFTGGVGVISVAAVTAQIVDVTVSGQVRGHSYTVDVDNVKDTDDQPVAVNCRATYFLGADAAGGIEGLIPRSLSRNYVSGNGGHPIEILGTFPAGEPMHIYLGPTGTVDDPQCFSGVPGQGKDIYSIGGRKVRFFTPVLPIGGPFTITIQVVGSGAVMRWTNVISALPPDYRSGVFSLRSLLPPIYKTGARKAEDLPEL